tara:strand:+ start:46374 stop:46610 length:237 start_codon:yes stop_codon:yes gene_type:complete
MQNQNTKIILETKNFLFAQLYMIGIPRPEIFISQDHNGHFNIKINFFHNGIKYKKNERNKCAKSSSLKLINDIKGVLS